MTIAEPGSGNPSAAPVLAAAGMVVWLVGLGIWGLGLFHVPAFGPWCDYSKQTFTTHRYEQPDWFEDAVVTFWAGDVETTWSPPGYSCPRGNPLAEEQRKLGAPKQDSILGRDPAAALLQVFLVATPSALWWAVGQSRSPVETRRRIAIGLIFGGSMLAGLGGWSIAGHAKGLGLVYLSIATVLCVVGLGYRRSHRREHGSPDSPVPTP